MKISQVIQHSFKCLQVTSCNGHLWRDIAGKFPQNVVRKNINYRKFTAKEIKYKKVFSGE